LLQKVLNVSNDGDLRVLRFKGETELKIETVEVLVTSPGRNFVTLKLTTSDGVVGLGDATLNGRELAVASYLRGTRSTPS